MFLCEVYVMIINITVLIYNIVLSIVLCLAIIKDIFHISDNNTPPYFYVDIIICICTFCKIPCIFLMYIICW